jgi:hypothetical protein
VREPEVVFSDGTHVQFDAVLGADGIDAVALAESSGRFRDVD